MGPYPRNRDANNRIFAHLDHFSNIILKPIRKAFARRVVKYLAQDVFHVLGAPEIVHSDTRKHFASVVFQDILRKYGAQHVKALFYSRCKKIQPIYVAHDSVVEIKGHGTP